MFADFVVHGIKEGFRIGPLRGKPLKNMRSTREKPGTNRSICSGRAARGLSRSYFSIYETLLLGLSRMGVIPKPHQPAK